MKRKILYSPCSKEDALFFLNKTGGSEQLVLCDVNYFCKILNIRCLKGFWIRLCSRQLSFLSNKYSVSQKICAHSNSENATLVKIFWNFTMFYYMLDFPQVKQDLITYLVEKNWYTSCLPSCWTTLRFRIIAIRKC